MSDGSLSLQKNGETKPFAADKPVNTYKRRKFFKSRGATEEVAVDSAPSLPTTSYVNTGSGAVAKTAAERNHRDSNNDFDSLLRGSRSSGSTEEIDYNRSNPSNLSTADVDLPTQTSYNRPPSADNKSGNSGIKLKIFKSRNTKSWSDDQYSSKVELPSDDSRSTSASTSAASSPSSVDVFETDKDISESVKQPPKSFNVPELTGKPSYSLPKYLKSSQSPVDSPIAQSSPTRDNSSLFMDNTLDSACVNTSLDSSAEFGELIDQKTGLPSSTFGKSTSESGDINDTIVSSATTAKSYSRSYSSSKSSALLASKSSPAVSTKEDVVKSSLSVVPSATAADHSTNNSSSSASVDKSYSYSRNGTRSYGNKSKNKPATYSSNSKSSVESDLSKEKLPLDVRNDCSQSSIFDSPASTTTSSLSSRVPVIPDLFSNDFDEDEIIDRTQLDVNSSSLDSNGSAEIFGSAGSSNRNTPEVRLPSTPSSEPFDGPSSLTAIGKAASMPARLVSGRNVPSAQIKEAAADANDSSALTKPIAGLPRKRSIFKSRVVQDGGSKKRATYNHKWHTSTDEKEDDMMANKSAGSHPKQSSSAAAPSEFDDFDFDGSGGASLKRVQSWSAQSTSSVLPHLDTSADPGSHITSVKCNKSAKGVSTIFLLTMTYL